MFSLTSGTRKAFHCIRGPSKYNKARKANKRLTFWKEKIKTVFSDDMMVYIEENIESTKKLLNLVSLAKFQDTRAIHTHKKSVVFLYIIKAQFETKFF